MSKAPKPKRTEAEMLAMLRDRYTEKAGNGDAWAFVTHVRDAAGFDAKRTIDGLAMSLWPSRGLLVHGFEVKCDRGDWLREMKNPAKAESFARLVDRFWLVVADEAIVKDGELPEPWGLLVVRGGRLVQKVEARPLHPDARELPPGLDRSFIASLLRAATKSRTALADELDAARRRGYEAGESSTKSKLERLEAELEKLRDRDRRFHEVVGVGLTDFSDRYLKPGETDHLTRLGGAIRAAMTGELEAERLVNRIKSLRDSADKIAEHAGAILGHYESDPLDSEVAA